MSALDSVIVGSEPVVMHRSIRVVAAGEVPAAWRRRAHARLVRRASGLTKVRQLGAVVLVSGVFGLATWTLVWAFLAVPGLPY